MKNISETSEAYINRFVKNAKPFKVRFKISKTLETTVFAFDAKDAEDIIKDMGKKITEHFCLIEQAENIPTSIENIKCLSEEPIKFDSKNDTAYSWVADEYCHSSDFTI